MSSLESRKAKKNKLSQPQSHSRPAIQVFLFITAKFELLLGQAQVSGPPMSGPAMAGPPTIDYNNMGFDDEDLGPGGMQKQEAPPTQGRSRKGKGTKNPTKGLGKDEGNNFFDRQKAKIG
jgi:hypothetical protein